MRLTSTMRSQRMNPNARNFGLGSRKMDIAGKNALWEKFNAQAIGFNAVDTITTKFGQFVDWVKSEFGVTDMRNLEKSHVEAYAEHFVAEVADKKMSASYAHDLLSAVNSVLSQARGDSQLRVTGKDTGMPSRSGVTTQSKAISSFYHQDALQRVDPLRGAILDTQRELGLRFEEACKLNAQHALNEALKNGQVTVKYGTKGGKTRIVRVTHQSQIDALRRGVSVQQGSSLIPPHQSYAQHQSESYRVFTQAGVRSHGERHAYAQREYEARWLDKTGVSGIKPPVVVGVRHGLSHHKYLQSKTGLPIDRVKALDDEVRREISKNLGHERPDITNTYLG